VGRKTLLGNLESGKSRNFILQ